MEGWGTGGVARQVCRGVCKTAGTRYRHVRPGHGKCKLCDVVFEMEALGEKRTCPCCGRRLRTRPIKGGKGDRRWQGDPQWHPPHGIIEGKWQVRKGDK